PVAKEFPTFSPDGKSVAYVREGNLCLVDLATQTDRALTSDGAALIQNGKADAVYIEEIFDRRRPAYWWSPDSSRLALLHFDDAGVRQVAFVDQASARLGVETTPYPKAGERNPAVKLGIVAASGGPVRWVELKDYPEAETLLIRAAWTPDSQSVCFYCQNRAQTWLDVCLAPRDGGEATRLFRDTTKAWVDDPGDPAFLKDGSFLIASERSGWKHLYHFAKDGRLIGPITSGPWEVSTLHLVDEESGWVYFSGTAENDISPNLYRVKLDGNDLQRLTKGTGEHRVSVGP